MRWSVSNVLDHPEQSLTTQDVDDNQHRAQPGQRDPRRVSIPMGTRHGSFLPYPLDVLTVPPGSKSPGVIGRGGCTAPDRALDTHQTLPKK